MDDSKERYVGFCSDRDKGENLHSLVVEFKDAFIGSEALQNMFLNRGYEMESGTRPTSFHDVQDNVWKRDLVSISLVYLDHAMGLATTPQIANITESPVGNADGSVLLEPSGDIDIRIATPEGHDFMAVEALQRGWFENPEVVERIREYHQSLSSAFDVFNLKLILIKMLHAADNFTPFETEEGASIKKRIRGAMDRKSYHELDSAYYSHAMSLMEGAREPWEYLFQNPYGKMFVLSREETFEQIKKYRGCRD